MPINIDSGHFLVKTWWIPIITFFFLCMILGIKFGSERVHQTVNTSLPVTAKTNHAAFSDFF